MPNAFAAAGYVLSVILISVIFLMSYISVTFMTESLAVANALIPPKLKGIHGDDDDKILSCVDPASDQVTLDFVDVLTARLIWVCILGIEYL